MGLPGEGVSQMVGWMPGMGGSGRRVMVGVAGSGGEVGIRKEESGKRVVAAAVLTKVWLGEVAVGRGRASLVWKRMYLL